MKNITRQNAADAFNLWMKDYTENPERFEEISRSAMRFLNEKLDGEEPTYGDSCAGIFFEYLDKLK